MWRSLVARTLGVREVAGSNPVIPTTFHTARRDFPPRRFALSQCQTHLAQLPSCAIDYAMPLILVTNDDSIYASGLRALVEQLQPLGEVMVVAPASEHSGCSRSVTLGRPLRIRKQRERDGWYAVEGTPTDCIVLALHWLLKGQPRPDIVVSGINRGANLGDSVTYSGTVAGALEGAVNGIPSLAFSLVSRTEFDYTHAAPFAARLTRKVLQAGLPKHTLLNVNIPPGPIRGYRFTRTGTKLLCTNIEERFDPRGRPYYWIGTEADGRDEAPDVDYTAIAEGLVAITPPAQ